MFASKTQAGYEPEQGPTSDTEPPSPPSERRVGIFLDIPNIETSAHEKGVRFEPVHIMNVAKTKGRVVMARAYGFATRAKGVTQGVVNSVQVGFDFIPRVLYDEGRKDIDTKMTADIVEGIINGQVDLVIICSGDSDYVPALEAARRRGVQTMVIAVEECLSAQLQRITDECVLLAPKVNILSHEDEATVDRLIPSEV